MPPFPPWQSSATRRLAATPARALRPAYATRRAQLPALPAPSPRGTRTAPSRLHPRRRPPRAPPFAPQETPDALEDDPPTRRDSRLRLAPVRLRGADRRRRLEHRRRR